jgi:hypothetical protein
VHEVRKIHLSDRTSEDMIAWHYEGTGMFNVRSAYRLTLQIENERNWKEVAGFLMGAGLYIMKYGILRLHRRYMFLDED